MNSKTPEDVRIYALGAAHGKAWQRVHERAVKAGVDPMKALRLYVQGQNDGYRDAEQRKDGE